jgi:hypothetical protein
MLDAMTASEALERIASLEQQVEALGKLVDDLRVRLLPEFDQTRRDKATKEWRERPRPAPDYSNYEVG